MLRIIKVRSSVKVLISFIRRLRNPNIGILREVPLNHALCVIATVIKAIQVLLLPVGMVFRIAIDCFEQQTRYEVLIDQF